jgi:hypothetical protein
MKPTAIALWILMVPLSVVILVAYGQRWEAGNPGLMPRHVVVISVSYLMLATVAVASAQARWEQGITLSGLVLGIVALVIVLRREWSR